MIATVECRTISLGDGIPDLHVTTAALPQNVAGAAFLSRYVSDSGFVAPVELLGRVLRRLPLDPLGESGLNVTDLDAYSLRFLLAPLLSGPLSALQQRYRVKHEAAAIDELREALGSTVAAERLEFVCNQALAIGAALTTHEFLFLDWAWHNLKPYEVPCAHSPELGAIPLSKLIESGAKSACLVPLLTGVHGAVQAQLAGTYALAFESVVAGAGVTLVALSSLWVADKILRGVRSSTLSAEADDKASIVHGEVTRKKRARDAERTRREREIAMSDTGEDAGKQESEDEERSSAAERDRKGKGV